MEDESNMIKNFKHWRKVIYTGIGVVCVVAIAIGVKVSNKEKATLNNDINTNEISNVASFDADMAENELKAISSAGAEEAEAEPLLMEEGFPKINALITKFFNAKLESSENAFDGLVTDPSGIDYERLHRKVEYIVSYQNIKTYVAKGINEVDYVAYVTYDLELPSIETMAPSIDEIYISLDENNKPLVYLGKLSEETQEFVDDLRNTEEVKSLISGVTDELTAAVKSDSNLKDFYDSFAGDN